MRMTDPNYNACVCKVCARVRKAVDACWTARACIVRMFMCVGREQHALAHAHARLTHLLVVWIGGARKGEGLRIVEPRVFAVAARLLKDLLAAPAGRVARRVARRAQQRVRSAEDGSTEARAHNAQLECGVAAGAVEVHMAVARQAYGQPAVRELLAPHTCLTHLSVARKIVLTFRPALTLLTAAM